MAVSAHVGPLDAASPGWAAAGGWGFVLRMVQDCTLLILAPAPLVALLVPLCLIGWMAWPGAFGRRGLLVGGGYLCAFMLVGRPDNTYWILMVGPLLMPGLAFAPAALRDIGCAALPRRRGAGA